MKSEIKRALFNYRFICISTIGIIIAILHSYSKVSEYIYISKNLKKFAEIGQNPYFPISSAFTMWMGWDDESKYSRIFFIIFPLIAVLPYCWSYCSDYKNGYTNIAIEKLGKFKYHKSKYIAVFISSGLVISIPLIVDFLIILLFIPATVPDSVYDIYYGIFSNNFMAGMFYSTPFMYIIIFILLNFVYCGLFGCIGYAASTLIKNKIISALSPNIIVLTTEFIKNIALEKNSIQSNNFSPFSFLFPAKSLNTNWFIIVTEIVLLFVCTFGVSTLRLREKSNLNLRYFYEK